MTSSCLSASLLFGGPDLDRGDRMPRVRAAAQYSPGESCCTSGGLKVYSGRDEAWSASPRRRGRSVRPPHSAPTPTEPTPTPTPAYRLCWGAIYALLLGTLAFQLYTATNRFLEGAISQHWDIQGLEKIPVPAITICHGNKFKKDVVLRSTVNGTQWADWVKDGLRLLRWGEVDFDSFFWNASYRWSDMVTSCEVQSANCSAAGTFYETATHMTGLCTTFVSNITVRQRHIGAQILLTLTEQSATGKNEHAGWHVFFHSPDVQFTSVTVFSGMIDQILVSPGRVVCVDLTPLRVSRMHRRCSSRPAALAEFEACVLEQIKININATSDGPCQLPSSVGVGRSCTSFQDYLTALAVPEEELNEPDFFLWSAGHACQPPCDIKQFRKDAQQSLRLDETQQPLLHPELAGHNTALLRLRLADTHTRLTERLAYPLDAFVADVGGHLGLLLGGSVLAVLQLLEKMGRAARRRLRH